MKKNLLFCTTFIAVLLILASASLAADAYVAKIRVLVDGSAIQPNKEVQIYFTLNPNSFHELYWLQYDRNGNCKGYRATTYTYPHDFDQSSCTLTVTFDKPVTRFEATTGYGNTLATSLGNLTGQHSIGVRKTSLSVN